jgi:hypothetical protein
MNVFINYLGGFDGIKVLKHLYIIYTYIYINHINYSGGVDGIKMLKHLYIIYMYK